MLISSMSIRARVMVISTLIHRVGSEIYVGNSVGRSTYVDVVPLD